MMIKNFLKLLTLISFNYLVLLSSKFIDVDQLFNDLNFLNINGSFSYEILFLFVSFSIGSFTLLLIYFFQPFSEIYLLHYLKFSYYFLVNLLSLSTVYLTFRIYGYSRLSIIFYLFGSSLFLLFIEKIQFKKYS